jgi:molecular chaperone GrpE
VIPPEEPQTPDSAPNGESRASSAPSEELEDRLEEGATPEPAEDARIISAEEMTYLEQLQRLQAEFTNFRRRIQREKAEWDIRAKGEVLTGLLPILDALDRARSFWETHPPDADAEGLLLTLTRLEDYARSVGLERQPTDAGTPFDANGHEALLTSPSEEYPEGTILETLQPGYLFRGLLLRPARVRVSRGPAVEPS